MDPEILSIIYKLGGLVLAIGVICFIVWLGCRDQIIG